ncbi:MULTISPECIES: DUF4331 family protein [Flavobacterium]|uniref:DUF4331 domain-containing protein n=1 Tax=Flavobacterium gawalongense TaxID=2594432 RepID=A0A553BBC6_9FLAO|nr:DUF4331 family protein [Flavobacterium gawalongense]TRW97187.1 DUF4331 domain-containing protein [Flavobacterium gawalongense]TRX02142.1 DUF4331 domain-containing protein [Flavobacterium gawalongense]TRX05552.1 DUF4331 domain-containing protein [Flavobacterium gawalongense]TRX06365.1 DUF4331 domain-containing protein [Flavobacterium gawalongense]TRX21992.1 DUF4331 domain-containing protein [Flavobacterium gawalongense]
MSKTNKFKIITIALVAAVVSVNCDNDDSNGGDVSLDFSGTFVQQDQMARPAINTVFIASGQPKDDFNAAIPSAMGIKYQSIFQSRLLALNPAFTTNALGQTAAQFTGLLATDVLNVSKTAKTTFFDGTNVLTGRALADDVIDVELLLIFGGPTGGSNPGLTSDNVDANDKTFGTTFPYLASAW